MCPCVLAMHFMFLLPIFTLLIIKGIEDLQTQSVIPIVFTLLIQGFLSQKLGFENQWLLFLPIILAFIWFLVKRDKNVLIIGIMVGLFSIFYQNAKLNDGLQYQAQKQLSTFIFNQGNDETTILSY